MAAQRHLRLREHLVYLGNQRGFEGLAQQGPDGFERLAMRLEVGADEVHGAASGALHRQQAGTVVAGRQEQRGAGPADQRFRLRIRRLDLFGFQADAASVRRDPHVQGLGIVAPLARSKPSYAKLAALGLIAGVPTIFGTWIGGFSYSPTASVLFLAIGAGAIVQVILVLGRSMGSRGREGFKGPLNAAGVVVGLIVMYTTGLFVAA